MPAEQVRQAHIKDLVDLPDPSLADLADLAHRPLPVGMQVVNEPKFIPTPAQAQWHNDLQRKIEARACELGATAVPSLGVGSTTRRVVGFPRKCIAFYRSIGASKKVLDWLLNGIDVTPDRPIVRRGPRHGAPNYSSCYQCTLCSGKPFDYKIRPTCVGCCRRRDFVTASVAEDVAMGGIWEWNHRAKALLKLFGRSWDSLTKQELKNLGGAAPYAECSLGVAPKPGKEGRLICDQRSFNQAFDKPKCELEKIERYLLILRSNDVGVEFDLEAAYKHLLLCV